MNNKQLAVIFKPICNDQIIMYLIAKQLRTIWFKQKQRELFKVYKKYKEVLTIFKMGNENMDIYRLEDNRPWTSYRWGIAGTMYYRSRSLQAGIRYIRISEQYDDLRFISCSGVKLNKII